VSTACQQRLRDGDEFGPELLNQAGDRAAFTLEGCAGGPKYLFWGHCTTWVCPVSLALE
jgi:hypothetical protein